MLSMREKTMEKTGQMPGMPPQSGKNRENYSRLRYILRSRIAQERDLLVVNTDFGGWNNGNILQMLIDKVAQMCTAHVASFSFYLHGRVESSPRLFPIPVNYDHHAEIEVKVTVTGYQDGASNAKPWNVQQDVGLPDEVFFRSWMVSKSNLFEFGLKPVSQGCTVCLLRLIPVWVGTCTMHPSVGKWKYLGGSLLKIINFWLNKSIQMAYTHQLSLINFQDSLHSKNGPGLQRHAIRVVLSTLLTGCVT
jgi:hypothetical protein